MHELLAHLKGMRHMIQLRGGYQNLGLEGLLSKMIIVYAPYFDPNLQSGSPSLTAT